MNYVQYFSYADYTCTIYCNVFKKPVWLIYMYHKIKHCTVFKLHMNRFNLIYGDVIILYTNKQN